MNDTQHRPIRPEVQRHEAPVPVVIESPRPAVARKTAQPPQKNWRQRLQEAQACIHRGEKTGEQKQCKGCGGGLKDVYACVLHGKCIIDAVWPGIKHCGSCRDRQATRPVDVGFFARTHVISLKRTPERLAAFWQRWPADWPYRQPEVWEAVDGMRAILPPAWDDWPNCSPTAKRGAYGCRESWLSLIRKAMADGINGPLLVFEDDAQLLPDAVQRLPGYLAALPADWQICYLGCQHMTAPEPIAPGIVRCTGAERTHALALHPAFLPELERIWSVWNRHIDWRLRNIAQTHRFYAPEVPLAGQAAGFSAIMGRQEGYREWRR